MEKKKSYQISLFLIGCILFDYFGKILVKSLNLPLWFDSLGTCLTAYTLGPICGAIVGATVNILYGLQSSVFYMSYALVNIAAGVTVGVCAKKGYMERIFGVLSISFLVTVISVIISTPLNFIFFDGSTGNIWGDGVSRLLQKAGCGRVLSSLAGEFYLDFLDKVVAVFVLFCVVKTYRRYGKGRAKRGSACLIWLAAAGYILCCTDSVSAEGGEQGSIDIHTYVQTVYNGQNGLTGGTANDLAQTKDGILWVGTDSGLYRYNGTKFRSMDEFETVKNVNCLYTDESGRLWIGTGDGGLTICINEQVSNVLDMESGLPSDCVHCVTQSTEGAYYVGTASGLSVVTLSGGLTVRGNVEGILDTRSVCADRNKNVAAVTEEGRLYLVRDSLVADQKEVQGVSYTSCAFDVSGMLYAGTEAGRIDLYQVQEGALKKQRSLFCGELYGISSFYFSEDGKIFVCADNGAGYFDLSGEFHMLATDDFDHAIGKMLMDYQGNLWFTSSRLGLLRMCRSVFFDVYRKAELTDNVVNAVVKWQDQLYFGTDQGLDAQQEMPGFLREAMEGVRICCLMVDGEEHLWVCTEEKGIYEIEKDGKMKNYNSQIGTAGDSFCTVTEMTDGTVAAAGDLGITYIRDGKVTGTTGYQDGLGNLKILCLLETKDGRLLAGTDGAGIVQVKDGKVIDTRKRRDVFGSGVILRMVSDSDGAGIYVVTGSSICFLRNDGTVRRFGNFPYYDNYDIVDRGNGTLLVSSSAGVYVADKKELFDGGKLEYELFDYQRGLQKRLTPNAWNYLDEQNHLYFAANMGVICMDLEYLDTEVRSYRILVKSIQADGIDYPVERGEDIRLQRGVRTFKMMPEIVNYTMNDPFVGVWLEGYEKEPTVLAQSSLSEISYQNLPAGAYTFHLSILDRRGKNVTAERVFRIVKEKEIYDFWWFRLYVIVVFALAIVYLSWLFFRTQIQKTLNLQKREVELANETILTIARTVDAKDENTSQHSIRVSEYSVLIAEELGFDRESCEELRKTALLHDIGKIGIPDSVLNKPARLTEEEYAVMKSHVLKGAEILKNFTSVKNVEEGALYHHERYDGKGYMHGLKGEEIPINARIIGIADAFDAMTANRVYRRKLDLDFVLEELKKGRGTQFDPQLVDILLKLIEKGAINMEQLYQAG